jgi:tRNA threonylcarbamoyladenosine biosynthesis protein TsaE
MFGKDLVRKTQRFSTTLKDIPKLTKQLSNSLRGGEVIALIGDLGAGKTTFAKELAKRLGITKTVPSPTFALLQSFSGVLPKNKKKVVLYHLDIYRTNSFTEVKHLGIIEHWNKPNTVTIIEWADKIAAQLPPDTIYVYFK